MQTKEDSGRRKRERQVGKNKDCKLAGPPQSVFSDLSRLN